jgi:phospholipase C
MSKYSLGVIHGLVLIGLSLEPARVKAGGAGIPIEHFIYIIQENHSFDNYFGTFPGANGIPAGTALPDYPGGPLVNKPFLSKSPTVPRDLPHTWKPTLLDYDNGAMDGFLWGEWNVASLYYGQAIHVPKPDPSLVRLLPKPRAQPTAAWPQDVEVLSPHGYVDDEDDTDVEEQNDALPVPTNPPNPKNRPAYVQYTLSYLDSSVIPNYWEYARKFTLCDNFFGSVSGPSEPNHLYTVAAQSGGLEFNATGGCVLSFPSIIELLGQANVTWKYYSGKDPTVEHLWNPLPGFRKYANDPNLDSHLAWTGQFYRDLKAGNLPQVCWLTPNGPVSEHPPANVQDGMWYVTDLINAVMRSSYWQNCAIIVTWDEFGGFYDHVPPIQIDGYGLGLRVPTIVISPYSISGTVVHTQYDLTSPLKLVETKFGLSSLTARDGSSNTMLECFNFSQTPLPPIIINKNTKLDFSDMPTRTP